MSSFGGPGDGAGPFSLTGEDSGSPDDGWYVAMRWSYSSYKGQGWLANRRLILTHAAGDGMTHQVVVRAADWGPSSSTGRVIDVGPKVADALGADTDSSVTIAWDPSNNLPLGPYTPPPPTTAAPTTTTTAPPPPPQPPTPGEVLTGIVQTTLAIPG